MLPLALSKINAETFRFSSCGAVMLPVFLSPAPFSRQDLCDHLDLSLAQPEISRADHTFHLFEVAHPHNCPGHCRMRSVQAIAVSPR